MSTASPDPVSSPPPRSGNLRGATQALQEAGKESVPVGGWGVGGIRINLKAASGDQDYENIYLLKQESSKQRFC